MCNYIMNALGLYCFVISHFLVNKVRVLSNAIITIFEHVQKKSCSENPVFIGDMTNGCRFCGSNVATFRNRSHTIPEFLGNKSLFNRDECDACNTLFGQSIEVDLRKFIPPNFITRIKGKKGYTKSQMTGGIQLNADSRYLNIELSKDDGNTPKYVEVKGSKYNSLNVYKVFVKMLISLMPDDSISDFKEFTDWLRNGSDFSLLKHDPILIMGISPPSLDIQELMDVTVTRTELQKESIFTLELKVNNLRFVLPFSPKHRVKFTDIIPVEHIPDKEITEVINLSNYNKKHNFRIELGIDGANSYFNRLNGN